MRTPTTIVQKTVEKGIEPKSQVAIVFTGPFEYNQTQRVAIRAMAEILSARLLETIREDLGGTYSINATARAIAKIPQPEYTISDRLRLRPEAHRRSRSSASSRKSRSSRRTARPTSSSTDEKEALLKDFDSNMKQNGYLLEPDQAEVSVRRGPGDALEIPTYYRNLDAATVQQAAKTYLNTTAYVQVVLMPEKK